MHSEPTSTTRAPISEWLLLALIVSLAVMKPALDYPIVLTDAIFLMLLLAVGTESLLAKRPLEWRSGYWVLILYVASLSPSLLASPDVGQSAFKLATQFYLVALAVITASLVTSERMLRRVVLAWLTATAAVAIVAILSLAAFLWAPHSALMDYSRIHFGTLPVGHYPRLALTFYNANMLSNYLTVSLGLLLIAERRAWLSRRICAFLLIGIGLAVVPTLSPGLGGIALALGLWLWVVGRGKAPGTARVSLILGLAVAALFAMATTLTPIMHSTAPFVIQVPGTDLNLAPSARYLTWSAAAAEFARHPLIGHGIGIEAVDVRFMSPEGVLYRLTDAHNMLLNIAVQAGLVGLAGLLVLIAYAARLSLPWRLVLDGSNLVRLGLGLIFLNGLVYHGLSGSFEDARHLWVLLGLLIAAAHLEVSRAGGNSRTAAAPSPC